MMPRKFTQTLLPFVMCGLACLFYVYDYFLQVAPSVITSQLMSAFNINAEGLGLLGSCFFLSYTIMQIPAGILLDRFGARRLLFLAVFVSAIGCVLFGKAEQVEIAGFARLLIGAGAAFSFLGSLYLAARWFEHRYFALIAGLVQLAGALGSIGGGAPLAMAVNHFGWRSVLVFTGVLTFVLSGLFWLILRDQPAQAFSTAPLISTTKMSVAFRPLQIWWIAICGFACWIPVTAMGALWGVPYVMKAYGWTNTEAGGIFIWFWLGMGFGSPLIGWWSDWIKSRKIPFIVCFALGLVSALGFIYVANFPHWILGVILVCLGICSGLQTLTFGIAKDITSKHHFSAVSGLINMAAILSGAIGQPLLGYLINWHHLGSGDLYTLANYQRGFWVIPLVMLLGLLVSAFLLQETRCQVIAKD